MAIVDMKMLSGFVPVRSSMNQVEPCALRVSKNWEEKQKTLLTRVGPLRAMGLHRMLERRPTASVAVEKDGRPSTQLSLDTPPSSSFCLARRCPKYCLYTSFQLQWVHKSERCSGIRRAEHQYFDRTRDRTGLLQMPQLPCKSLFL